MTNEDWDEKERLQKESEKAYLSGDFSGHLRAEAAIDRLEGNIYGADALLRQAEDYESGK